MSERDLVSVLMASYNYGRYVEDAVRSVWAQDYRPLELIAVDDGSTDDTVDVLKRLQIASPVPMNVITSPHKGVASALNVGLRECTGRYVSLLHADDFYRSDKITKQLDAITAAGPQAVVVHSEYTVVDQDGTPTGYTSEHEFPPASGSVLEDLLLLRAMIRPMTPLYKKSALLQIGGYDEGYPTEDWVCSLRLAAIGTVAHVPEALVFRRIHTRNHGTHTSRTSAFSPTHYGHQVIVDVTPPHLPLDRVLGLHAATLVRHALGAGAWVKAWEGSVHLWRSFPKQRHRLINASLSGLRSFIWLRFAKDRLPKSFVLRLVKRRVRYEARRRLLAHGR